MIAKVSKMLHDSIAYALEHREAAVDCAIAFGRGLDRAKTDRFVGMYVNQLTLSYGARPAGTRSRQHLRHNACMDERRQQRAARMTVRRYASSAEADRDDLGYWRQMPDAERVLHTWRLSVELWRLRGDLPDEPGLCRSVARVHRR